MPLWAAVALALNALPQPANAAVNRLAVARILPVPVAGVVALLFFLNVFNPVASCADQVRTGESSTATPIGRKCAKAKTLGSSTSTTTRFPGRFRKR